MTFRQGTEEYYKKFLELQEKLRKSEEERLNLEMKFNEMMQVTREEEQLYYRKLRTQYKQFLDENRKRQDRNERILRLLERIESRATMLEAKTRRFQLLRRQYQSFLKRICSQKLQEIKENDTKTHPKSAFKTNTNSDMYPNSVYQTERKDILKQYLDEMESRNISTNASTIADDIMNSIYSRKHFHKEDLSQISPENKLKPNIRFEEEQQHIRRKKDTPLRKLDLKQHTDKFDSSSEDDFNSNKYKDKGSRSVIKLNDNINPTSYPTDKFMYDNCEEELKQGNICIGNSDHKKNDNPIDRRYLDEAEYDVERKRKEQENDKSKNCFDVLKAGIEKPFEKNIQYQLGDEDKEKEKLKNTEIFSGDAIKSESNRKEDKVEAYEKENNESSEKSLLKTEDNGNTSQVISINYEVNVEKEAHIKNEQEELNNDLNYDENRKIIGEYDGNSLLVELKDIKDDIDCQLNETITDIGIENKGTVVNKMLQKENDIIDKSLIDEKVTTNETKHSPETENHETIIEQSTGASRKAIINEKLVESSQYIKPDKEQTSEVVFNTIETININDSPRHDSKNATIIQEVENIDAIADKGEDYLQNEELKETISINKNEIPTDNIQNMQPHENDEKSILFENDEQSNHYEANGSSILLDQQDIQYDQNEQSTEYDEYGQPIHYDQHGQQIQYDEHGQPIHYDENGQPIQYDEQGQQIHYDENGQQILYDEHGQQVQYDEHGQQLHFDENGQQIHYDENGQQLHYDENGQQIHYDTNGQQIQFDENGQQITYDEDGQPTPYNLQYDVNGRPIQYDENGQPLQFEDNGQFIQFDANQQQIRYDENNQHQDASNSEENIRESNKNENGQGINIANDVNPPINPGQGDLSHSKDEQYDMDQSEESILESSQIALSDIKDAQNTNVMDLLETDSESMKQDTKISHDSDFDFSNN